jgi:hypothetical protein
MIKFYVVLCFVLYSSFSNASANSNLSIGESFTFLGDSILTVNDFGKVLTRRYLNKTNGELSIYALPKKYSLRYTGRYFAHYLSQHGYKITDWYSQDNFFILDVIKINPNSGSQNGVVVLNIFSEDIIFATVYLTNVISSRASMNWTRSNVNQIQLYQELKTSIGTSSEVKPKVTSSSTPSNIISIIPPVAKMSFMSMNYQLKDSMPMSSAPGYQYEFLPAGQEFASWRNLLTLQIMPPVVEPSVLAKIIYMNAKKRKDAMVPERAVFKGESGDIYVVCYLAARASSGNGEVYVTTQGLSFESVIATADLSKTKSNFILELNVHKVYRDKNANNSLVDLFYAERRYGKVSASELLELDSKVPLIIKNLESLQVNYESAPKVKAK